MKTIEEIMGIMAHNNCIIAANLETASLSYPVPGKEGDGIVERFFLTSNQPAAVRRRPYAWLQVDTETGRLLQYAHCSVQDFAASLDAPFTDMLDYSAPGGGSYRELLAKKQEFAKVYGEVREFVFADELDSGQQEKVRRYIELRDQVIGSQVLEYYRVLSPEFFAWLDQVY